MGAGTLSLLVIAFLILNAQRLGLVQDPVARSSHVVPTPTGGGAGIVVGSVVAILALGYGNSAILAVVGLSMVIAALGLLDDRWPLSAKIRFPVQFIVIAIAVSATGAITAITGLEELTAAFFLVGLVIIVGGVWWLNLFNFMDGIDGLAGQQAIAMLGSAMLLSGSTQPGAIGDPLWWTMAITATATVAFLSFNWPPAKIFMGDIGSTFLGFMIFAIAAMTIHAGWMTLPQWAILAVLFAADATVTLITRLLRGQRVTQAHRSHAYQRLSRRGGSAKKVTVTALAINLLLLLPAAFIFRQDDMVAYCAAACLYIVFSGLFIYAGAGRTD
jgi:Fuc2NAc and GlcNAc transferase